MLVKSVDLRNQKLLDVISDVLCSGQFVNSHYVHEFAEKFADYCGATYCVPVSSGTDAIRLALNSFKILEWSGDKVVIPNLSFFSTTSVVVSCGYIPVFCDVDENGLMDMNMCKELLDKYDDIACVIPVNLYGQYIDIPQYIRERIPIIDDACQAHGIFGQGIFSNGSQSLASCYSFYPSKNLGAIGDAGAVVTNDKTVYELALSMSNYGCINDKYEHSYPEYSGNYRMDEIQAAVLCHKLDKLSQFERNVVADYYIDNEIETYTKHAASENVYHQYPILVDDRNLFIRKMKEYQIEIGIHYSYILSDKVPGIVEGCVASKTISDHCVSLPIGDHLADDDLSYVVNAFDRIIECKEDNIYIVNREL